MSSTVLSEDTEKSKGKVNRKRKKLTDNDTSSKLSESLIENPVNPKKRIKKYCPNDARYDLECEWKQCDFISNSMDDYLAHLDDHLDHYSDQTNQTYECEWRDCNNEEFNCEFTFKRHVRYHAFHTKLKKIGESVLKSIEEKIDPNQQPTQKIPRCNLDEQTRNLIPELPFKFECSWAKCEYSADNPELFYRHIRTHIDAYSSKLKDAKCQWNECEQIIKDKNRMVEHIRHHSQEKLVSCPVCGALFSSFTKFIDHSNRTCDLRSLCFQCSHCNKKFATNNLLKEHIRKHINKTKCPICDMTCIDKNDLSKHILYKHTTHKAFICEQCGHSCKTQNDLNKHIDLKHNERLEYQCDECAFKTKDINSMKRHMLKFHMNNENAINFKDSEKFSCSYMCHVEGCGKVYCQGAILSKHLKTTHNIQWPSGHSRFRYKLESDGFYRLQTLRYESIELVELLNKNVAAEAFEIETNLVTEGNSKDMSYLVSNEIATDNLNSNIMQKSIYSTEHSETNNSCKNNENENEQNKIFYNGIVYFNMDERNQSIEKEANNNSFFLTEENVVNETESFTELETVSNIQTDNPKIKSSNNRIEFNLENFFTDSLVTSSIAANSLNNDLNNMQQYSDLSKQESNYYNYNNVTEDSISCGLNNFKIFSMDTRF